MSTFINGAVEIGDEATPVCTVPPGTSMVVLQNAGDAPVFVGGPAVATSGESQGIQLAAGETVTLPSVDPDANELFAVVAKGSTVVVFLHS